MRFTCLERVRHEEIFMSNNADHEFPGCGLRATIFTIGLLLVVITTYVYNVYPRNGILEVLVDIFFLVGLLLVLAAIASGGGRIAERKTPSQTQTQMQKERDQQEQAQKAKEEQREKAETERLAREKAERLAREQAQQAEARRKAQQELLEASLAREQAAQAEVERLAREQAKSEPSSRKTQSPPMRDAARESLRQLVMEYGRSICEDPLRCRSLLLDVCGEYRREINVLMAVLEEHVVADLLALPASVPRDLFLARLTRRVCENRGLAQEVARWGVQAWVFALGL
jgi:hypothetical protein